jgi:hypothetical protein
MKTKLVLWATKPTAAVEGDAAETPQKVLLALSLLPEENKVKTRIIEGDDATQELAKTLIQGWTKGEDVAFPESTSSTESELSAKLPLLADGLVADQPDLLSRIHTEWLFLVLSNKLFQAYLSEIDEMQNKVEVLEKYSKSAWDMLKSFWDKVQQQIVEKSIFRGHTDQLRLRINVLFDRLKALRAQEDAAAEVEARKGLDAFIARVAAAEEAIAAVSNNNESARVFDMLKTIQQDFQPLKLSKNLRNELWNRIDTAFKTLKEKRNPAGTSNNSNNNNKEQAEQRLTRRVEGLHQAIAKMEESVRRDKNDLSAINDRPSNAGGNSQLESQLREVRSKMVQERMDSKQLKLDDMLKTLKELESQIERMQQREKAAAAKAAAKAAKEAEAKVEEAEAKVEEAEVEVEEMEAKATPESDENMTV